MGLRMLGCLRIVVLITFSSAIVWIAAGCEPDRSINPFYAPQDVVYDANLTGNWQEVESSNPGSLVVKARSKDSYTVELAQNDKDRKEDTDWTFEAHAFNYQEKTYIDLLPTAFQVRGKNRKFQTDANDLTFLVPVHTVMRLSHDGQNLSLSWTGSGEMSSFFKKEDEAAKEKRLAREKRQRAILAMSTEQLQKEVLGLPPEGDTAIEMGMHFVRKN